MSADPLTEIRIFDSVRCDGPGEDIFPAFVAAVVIDGVEVFRTGYQDSRGAALDYLENIMKSPRWNDRVRNEVRLAQAA